VALTGRLPAPDICAPDLIHQVAGLNIQHRGPMDAATGPVVAVVALTGRLPAPDICAPDLIHQLAGLNIRVRRPINPVTGPVVGVVALTGQVARSGHLRSGPDPFRSRA